jgi:hypothetical protein
VDVADCEQHQIVGRAFEISERFQDLAPSIASSVLQVCRAGGLVKGSLGS